MKPIPNNDRVLVFLRAPARGGGAALRHQWQRNGVDLPCADGCCVFTESTAALHAQSAYTVVIDDGVRRDVQPPAVMVSMRTPGSPPWHWPALAAELHDRPDLFATLATVFRGLCVAPADPRLRGRLAVQGIAQVAGGEGSGPVSSGSAAQLEESLAATVGLSDCHRLAIVPRPRSPRGRC